MWVFRHKKNTKQSDVWVSTFILFFLVCVNMPERFLPLQGNNRAYTWTSTMALASRRHAPRRTRSPTIKAVCLQTLVPSSRTTFPTTHSPCIFPHTWSKSFGGFLLVNRLKITARASRELPPPHAYRNQHWKNKQSTVGILLLTTQTVLRNVDPIKLDNFSLIFSGPFWKSLKLTF